MTVQESYNKIIRTIEEQIIFHGEQGGRFPDTKTLSEEAFAAGELSDLDDRARNELFKFLTGSTVTQYISKREMMLAYKILIEQKSYDIKEASKYSGLSSDNAFYKKFREYFDMTPNEAYQRKIARLYKGPVYWQQLSETGQEYAVKTVEVYKEVSREVRKFDKRPLIVVVSLLMVFIVCGGLFAKYTAFHNSWSGEFVLYKCPNVLANIGLADLMESDVTKYASVLGRKTKERIILDSKEKKGAFILEDGRSLDIEIISIDEKEMQWMLKHEGKVYSAVKESDGSISTEIFYADGTEEEMIRKIRLIKPEQYEKWKNHWEGWYYPQERDEDDYFNSILGEDTQIRISIDPGLAFLFYIRVDECVFSYVTYFNDEYMTIEIVRKNSSGEIETAELRFEAEDDSLFTIVAERVGNNKERSDTKLRRWVKYK